VIVVGVAVGVVVAVTVAVVVGVAVAVTVAVGVGVGVGDGSAILTQAENSAGSVAVAVIISPEKLDGERGPHLDDIYSRGATIYELLKVSREAC
jgi:hypothetical protein